MTITLLANSTTFADAEQKDHDTAPRLIQVYDDNPNLAHVLAYKTQELMIDSVKKVGDATEKGIEAIKPSVDRAWEGTKKLTTRGSEKVSHSSKQIGSAVSEKIQDTQAAVVPKREAHPLIEQKSLSSDDSTNNQKQTDMAQTYPVTD